MPDVQLAHPPRTREELWWAVFGLFGVIIPRTKVCPDHCAPFDAFADAYFNECTIGEGEPYYIQRAVWHASRGLAGKSKTLSVLGLTFGYVNGADITILGGSLAQSVNVHAYMTTGMGSPNLPRDMVLDQTSTQIRLMNKGRVRPLTASQKTVRGPHPSKLLMDEVDEMDLDIYDAALGQPMPQPDMFGNEIPEMTVISSTWQNAQGTLTEIFERIEEQEPVNDEGDKKTPIYRWCYKENHRDNNPQINLAPPEDPPFMVNTGWLGENTIQGKKDSVSIEMFRIEYDLGEPSIGNRAVDTDLLDANFSLGPEEPGGKPIWEKHDKDWDEWRFEKPIRGATYVSGTDWAKEKDYTVITIARIDEGFRRPVYVARIARRSYLDMVGRLNDEQNRYGMAYEGAWHDATGLGNVINDLTDENTRPFTMVGEKRTKLLSDYVLALEKVTWRIPKCMKKIYTEHKYCSVGDLYNTSSKIQAEGTRTAQKEFHLPDSFCSFALAEYGAKKGVMPGAPMAVGDANAPLAGETLFSMPEEGNRSDTNTLIKGSIGDQSQYFINLGV